MSRASARAPTGSCGTQLMTAPSSFTTWSVNWLMSCGAWAETVRKLVMHGPGGAGAALGREEARWIGCLTCGALHNGPRFLD